MSPAPRRRLIAPEVIQTSAMDCGPASLLCLLQGHGIDVSYGRLREACQTDVDGTSLTALEEVGARLGLATAQVMLPADHVLRPEAEALPALLTLRLPDGAPHFVVGWRRIGRWVQLMDPAAGRRWLSVAALEGELYQHVERVPAAAWRAWAAEDAPRATWAARLTDLGLAPAAVAATLDGAFADPGCGGIAALDAACRATQAMLRAGVIQPGPTAATALAHLLDDPLQRIPIDDWSVQPADPDEDGAPMLELRAAVLVRVDGRAPPPPDAPPLSPELAAAVAAPDPSALTALAVLLRADGPQRPLVIIGGAAILAAGGLAQALALRAALELGPLLAGLGQRGAGLAGLAVAAGGLLAVELAVQLAARGAGQALELRLRVALHEKLPRLEDRYLSSRPASDLAARAHALHAVRALPELGAQLVRALASLGAAAGGLLLLRPAAAPLVLLAVAVAAGLPLLLQAPLTELDHRWKAQSASLSRYLFDALAGRAPLRSHGAGGALRRLHEEQLVHWVRTGRAALTATTGAELLMGLCGALLSAALLLGFVGAAPGGGLLLAVVWALQLPALGQDLGQLARQTPGISNLVRRLVEPLGAVEDPRAAPPGAAPAAGAGAGAALAGGGPKRGVALSLVGVDVIAAGHTVLEGVDLELPRGAQVAVVGESGAGKSTLLGLLLGWTAPAAGALTVDGAPLDAAGLAALRARTAWVDPAVQLWNEPLIDNLDYGAPDDAAPVGAAIANADLHGVLEGLPEGLAAVIGEGGALLSGGEGQRLRLARALRRQAADLVLLDEPFRGLARDQRAALLGAARRWWAGATLLCVSHDLAETASFDRVLVFAGGRLVEDGAPEALLAAGGEYARLMDAERIARAALAPGAGWGRLWLVGGRIKGGEETLRSFAEGDALRAHPVPVSGGAGPADPAGAWASGPGAIRSFDDDGPQRADPVPGGGGAGPSDPAGAWAGGPGVGRLLLCRRVFRSAGRVRVWRCVRRPARSCAVMPGAVPAPGPPGQGACAAPWNPRQGGPAGRLRAAHGSAARQPAKAPLWKPPAGARPAASVGDEAVAAKASAAVGAFKARSGSVGPSRGLGEDDVQRADLVSMVGDGAPAEAGLAAARWPAEALPAAVAALATAVGAVAVEGALPPGPPPGAAAAAVEAWLCEMAAWRGAEALPVSAPPGGLDALLTGGAPALLWWGERPQDGALLLIGARGGAVELLGPDLRPVRLPVARLGDHLRARLPAQLRAGVEQLLAAAPPAGGVAEARARLLALRGADHALSVGLLLRLPPSAPLWALLRHNGLLRGALLIGLGHAAEVGVALGGAALLARGALVGQLAAGWLSGWALMALGAALLRGAVLWAEGAWALRLGALLRRRLLVGALHLPADQVRRAGLGQLLGTTLEAEALDALGPAGGALALFALLELGAALALLLAGAGGLPHALALLGWSLGVSVGVVIFARRRAAWSAGRLRLTHRLVESLVGHRTRLAQEQPGRWHLREDDALRAHQAAAAPMDRAAALLSALAPGGWTALGLAALGPAALAGAPPGALALGLAGVIAGAGALRKLGWGAAALIDAGVALAQVRPLLSAAAGAPRPPRPRPLPAAPVEAPLEIRGLRLRHPGRARPTLDGVDLRLQRGDHLLLLGPSGAGKSTLAAVLAGARAPDAGLLLAGGLDPRARGPEGWRAAVGLVPQFHENHVFATTLAFNLLLGQDWPPTPAALDAAEELCEALGLGPLLRRMPGGLLQLVGETGWRLSHGEQSRVFLARGLLSGAQLIIFDESLGALDPATLTRCLDVIRARAPAAILIAHP